MQSISTSLDDQLNRNDSIIENTLHTLLTENNDHFDDVETLRDSISRELDESEAITPFGDEDSDLLNGGKPLTLESLLGEDPSSHVFFDMDESSETPELSLKESRKRTAVEENRDVIEREEAEETGGVEAEGVVEEEEDAIIRYAKKLKLSNNAGLGKVQNTEPFLSPASLSPSLSSDGDSVSVNNSRERTISSGNAPKRVYKPMTCNTVKILNNEPIIKHEKFSPEKLTNEYTLHQVSDMKKRIINTHKLILNFNFLKEGYSRTSVELKKTITCLKDSEIHRAHLLEENENLKKQIAQLKEIRSARSEEFSDINLESVPENIL